MNLRAIDLNLLVIFHAIVEERSIGKAAEKVGLSQSAISHALRRLRHTFNDELVRWTPHGMELAARSMALAESVRNALARIEQARSPLHGHFCVRLAESSQFSRHRYRP
jgi:DNA-binding transcriptional LysR family regulator